MTLFFAAFVFLAGPYFSAVMPVKTNCVRVAPSPLMPKNFRGREHEREEI